MKKQIYTVLFVISVISIFLLEDGMIKDFSIARFAPPFIFVSLPFLFASFLGWKRGFTLSIAVSFATLACILFLVKGKGDGWDIIYATFFALFSVSYLIIAAFVNFIVNNFYNKNPPTIV
jgi:hypothetical protein